jgi:hypothetical protein
MPDCLPATTPRRDPMAVSPVWLRRTNARLRRLFRTDRPLPLLAAALLGHLALGLPWLPSFLFASLVVLTAPTGSPGQRGVNSYSGAS